MKTVRELVCQVQKAAQGSRETQVRTIISRPMWKLWNHELGDPEDCEPTEWKGMDSKRVYGSETIVVESDSFFSFSFKP